MWSRELLTWWYSIPWNLIEKKKIRLIFFFLKFQKIDDCQTYFWELPRCDLDLNKHVYTMQSMKLQPLHGMVLESNDWPKRRRNKEIKLKKIERKKKEKRKLTASTSSFNCIFFEYLIFWIDLESRLAGRSDGVSEP